MNGFRSIALAVTCALAGAACATATAPLLDDQGSGGDHTGEMTAGSAGMSGGSNSAGASAGGKSGSGSGGAGAGSGGAMTGGAGSSGGAGSGGGGTGTSGAGMGGGGSSGAGMGGGGSSGAGMGGGGTGGSGGQATGTCAGIAPFVVGNGTKYAQDAKVTSTCNNGTTCTQHQPPGENGKTYEFTCKDPYNCGTQDPGTTNWSTPPWDLVQECTQ